MGISTGIQGAGGGGGSAANLQAVTTAGNITTKDIEVYDGGGNFVDIQSKDIIMSHAGGDGVDLQVEDGFGGIATQTFPASAGIVQVSQNGLFLPVKKISTPGIYTLTRRDHTIEVDLTAGSSMDITLPFSLLSFPGLQYCFKIIAFGGVNPALKLVPEAGHGTLIEGLTTFRYGAASLLSVRIVNDGTNWFILSVYNNNFVTNSTSPTIAIQPGGGVGASAVLNPPFDNYAGSFTINIVGAAIPSSAIAIISFNPALLAIPRAVMLTYASRQTGTGSGFMFVSQALTTVNDFTIFSGSAAPPNISFTFYYQVIV